MINLVFIFVGALHCFLKFLFQQPATIFMRAHFLRKDLLARLFLLVEVFHHILERGDRFVLLFMRKNCAGLRINGELAVAAGTNHRKTIRFTHWLTLPRSWLDIVAASESARLVELLIFSGR